MYTALNVVIINEIMKKEIKINCSKLVITKRRINEIFLAVLLHSLKGTEHRNKRPNIKRNEIQ